jgi:hypothetical protein
MVIRIGHVYALNVCKRRLFINIVRMQCNNRAKYCTVVVTYQPR